MLKKKKTEHTEASDNMKESVDENINVDETGDSQQNTGITDEQEIISSEELLKQELAIANDRYLRLYAEFDNFRRRTIKEREEARKTEGKDLIGALLPVLDDFERAIKSTENATDINAVKEGVILIQNKLKNILTQKGLKEMEAKSASFDPDLHEAITNVPAPNDELKGKVIDELEKGYYLNDKVIRFAKVVVGA